jgi:N-acetylglutamate synthase-like GNAT family acetyltransferase
MEIFNGLSFRKFEENDVDLFTQIFKNAFDRDSQIHLGRDGGPPGYENGDFLKEWYLHKDVTSFAIYKDKNPIGGIAVWIMENHENFLGNVFIDPDLQDKGLGLLIWKFIEQKYPETKVWRTETPGFSSRNHYFYVNKCGFKIYCINDPKSKTNSGYLLEKIIDLFNNHLKKPVIIYQTTN